MKHSHTRHLRLILPSGFFAALTFFTLFSIQIEAARPRGVTDLSRVQNASRSLSSQGARGASSGTASQAAALGVPVSGARPFVAVSPSHAGSPRAAFPAPSSSSPLEKKVAAFGGTKGVSRQRGSALAPRGFASAARGPAALARTERKLNVLNLPLSAGEVPSSATRPAAAAAAAAAPAPSYINPPQLLKDSMAPRDTPPKLPRAGLPPNDADSIFASVGAERGVTSPKPYGVDPEKPFGGVVDTGVGSEGGAVSLAVAAVAGSASGLTKAPGSGRRGLTLSSGRQSNRGVAASASASTSVDSPGTPSGPLGSLSLVSPVPLGSPATPGPGWNVVVKLPEDKASSHTTGGSGLGSGSLGGDVYEGARRRDRRSRARSRSGSSDDGSYSDSEGSVGATGAPDGSGVAQKRKPTSKGSGKGKGSGKRTRARGLSAGTEVEATGK